MSLLVSQRASAPLLAGAAEPGREPVDARQERGPRRPLIVFAVLCACAAGLRVWMLAAPGVPPGVDAGNWLAYGHELLGAHFRPDTISYPPAVPLIVTGMVALFGPVLGLALVAGMASITPAAGAFALLRAAGLRWAAVALAAFLLPAAAIGEMAAWGGYPQLFGAGLVVWTLAVFDRWLVQGRGRNLVAAAALGALVLATSHLAAIVGAIAASVVVLTRSRARTAPTARRALIAGGLTLVAAVPLIGTYARLLPALAGSTDAEPALTSIGVAEIPARFAQIHGVAWPVRLLGLAIGFACLLRPRHARTGELQAVFVAYAVALAVVLAISGQPRLLYEVPLLSVLGLGLGAKVWSAWRRTIPRVGRALTGAGVAVAFIAVTVGGATEASRQRDQYQVLARDLVAAVEWIRDHTPADALIAVGPAGDAPLGWWVEGLAERQAVYAAPLRWLTFPEERIQAAEANLVFFRAGFPSQSGLHWARARGIDFVLVANEHAQTDPGFAPAYVNDRAAIYKIAGDPS